MEQIKHPVTLAYFPQRFMLLASVVGTWASNTRVCASLPVVYRHDGRPFIYTNFGYCPDNSGVGAWLAYDEMNDEYLLWYSEDDAWNYEQSDEWNLDNTEPQRFGSLASICNYFNPENLRIVS